MWRIKGAGDETCIQDVLELWPLPSSVFAPWLQWSFASLTAVFSSAALMLLCWDLPPRQLWSAAPNQKAKPTDTSQAQRGHPSPATLPGLPKHHLLCVERMRNTPKADSCTYRCVELKPLQGCSEISLSNPMSPIQVCQHSQGRHWGLSHTVQNHRLLVVAPAHAAETVVSFSGKCVLFLLLEYFTHLKVSTWCSLIKALRALFAAPPWSERRDVHFQGIAVFQ